MSIGETIKTLVTDTVRRFNPYREATPLDKIQQIDAWMDEVLARACKQERNAVTISRWHSGPLTAFIMECDDLGHAERIESPDGIGVEDLDRYFQRRTGRPTPFQSGVSKTYGSYSEPVGGKEVQIRVYVQPETPRPFELILTLPTDRPLEPSL